MPVIANGFDLIDIRRLRKTVDRFGERFLKRCFTPDEASFCFTKRDPVPGLAARYAAKEAISKALGTGIAHGITWRDIEITRKPGEIPRVHLHGEALKQFARQGGMTIHVSLTHEKHLAGAVVLIEST